MNSNRPSSYRKLTYLQKLSIVNRKLRIGDVARIAENTEYSPSHVSNVISGYDQNLRIVNNAYNMVRDRMANPQKIKALSDTKA